MIFFLIFFLNGCSAPLSHPTSSMDSARSSFRYDSETILEEEKASKRRRSGINQTSCGIANKRVTEVLSAEKATKKIRKEQAV